MYEKTSYGFLRGDVVAVCDVTNGIVLIQFYRDFIHFHYHSRFDAGKIRVIHKERRDDKKDICTNFTDFDNALP